MSPAIRLANAGDAGAILELWRLAATVTTRTDDEASLRSLIARDPEALLLAEEEGELVGSVIAAFDGWRGTFFRLAVLPERRRAGIGRALIAVGERSLRERGAARITLYAIKAEGGAEAFWLATDYAPDDRTARYVKNFEP
ncbi:MAG TPA: GNAT family N-acetyltransferase [Gaiellaceae bacterium]